MATQQVVYCTTDVLECETCLPSDIVLCVPNALTADGLGFIPASLVSYLKTCYCGVTKREYTIEYNDALLEDPNTPLLPCEISSAFCLGCEFLYLENLSSQVLTGWTTDADGNFIQEIGYNGDIIYNHSLLIVSNDDDGGLTLCGGSANSSANGANFSIQGIGAGGGAFLKGAFAAGGTIHLGQGAPNTFISIDNYLDARIWGFASNGDIQGSATLCGNIILNTLAKTLKVKAGTNGYAGTFVANGSTAVVVPNTLSSVTMVVIPSLKTVGGTPAGAPYISAISAGVSFSMKAEVGDTSTYNYVILETV